MNFKSIEVAACIFTALSTAAFAADVTDSIENLGIPLMERYPDNSGRTYARNVWDMKLFDNRVFVGSGNSANEGPAVNSGPVEVWAYDLASESWVMEHGPYSNMNGLYGEQIDLYREFSDGCLYIPEHDPCWSDADGYFKRRQRG